MLAITVITAILTATDLRQFEQIDSTSNSIGGNLDAVLAAARTHYHIAGVAAGAIKDGEVIWSARMGRASLDGRPVTGDTAFNVGSVSKPLVAWAVLALAQQREIELDAPVGRYLLQFTLPESELDPEQVTIRRLLQHTAGINIHGYGGYGAHEDQPHDAVELSTTFEPLALVREPGTKRVYSGGGYVLLQMMIEDVTGRDFNTALQALVFEPLGMNNTGFLPDALPLRSEAFGYYGNPIEDLRDVALAAAGAYVSGDDMERFLLAHINGERVLDHNSLLAATLPTEPDDRFGMSYTRWETPNGLLLGHGGNNSTWHSQIYVRPDTGDGFYFLANSTSGAQLDFELSCAWLSMMDTKEGEARCAEAIDLTHKIDWSAWGIAMLGLLVAYWLVVSVDSGERVLFHVPRDRSTIRLGLRLFALLVVIVTLGLTTCLFYTDLMMWRTGVTLMDEMPVDEIANLLTAITASLIIFILALWSSPRTAALAPAQ